MEYRPLGGSGLLVSELTLGAMMLGPWGNPDQRDCERIVAAAVDGGVNLIDTADAYSQGESERIVGRAVRDLPDVLVATKLNAQMGDGRNRSGQARRWVVAACEDSLRRLGRDHIDLYQLHRPDRTTALEETLEALSELVVAGKVRAVGASNTPAERIVEARWLVRRRGLAALCSEQAPYSILDRHVERAVLPTCERHGLGVLVWSPLNGGWLTGRHRRDHPPHISSRGAVAARHIDRSLPENQRKLELVEQLLPIAADLGCSMIGLAHAFVLSHPAVTSSIMGVRTMEQLAGQLDAPRRLPAGVLDRLDELVGPGTQVSPDWQTPDHYHRRVGRRRTDERGAAGGRIDGVADAAGWRR